MTDTVAAYDPSTDTWEDVAAYPSALAHTACGGIDGALYCTGGSPGGRGWPGRADSHRYDPDTDTWSRLPSAPSAAWGSQSAVANGLFVVNGGVESRRVTNRTFAFDPTTQQWATLPNSTTARYRGAAACGLYKLGGAEYGLSVRSDVEILPGMSDCGAIDVPWLELDTTQATLGAGESITVTMSLDPTVDQPGTYTTELRVKQDTPYTVEDVLVTMLVQAPDWARLHGVVNGQACDGTVAALAGATVEVAGRHDQATITTDEHGVYERWLAVENNPVELTVMMPDHDTVTTTVQVGPDRQQRPVTLPASGC